MQRIEVNNFVFPKKIQARSTYQRLVGLACFGIVSLCGWDNSMVRSEEKLVSTESVARRSPVVLAIRNSESAVVNIQGNKTVATAPSTAGGISSGKQEVNGMGTGVIIDPRGYIITNLHVVQDVSRIEVTLADGTVTEAKMLNFDPETDLALIRIPADRPLPVIPMGSSHDLMRGESVIAIGNPFGYQHSVTVGIISALHRNIPVNGTQEYRDLIQTNADINPGNSGGPLVNIEGRVIGINVAVRIGAQGIGFAIPIDAAREVMADLVAASVSKDLSLGLACETQYQDSDSQVKITSVELNSNEAALSEGDIVQSIDGREVHSRLDMQLCLIGRKSGDAIPIVVERADQKISTAIRLVSSSDDLLGDSLNGSLNGRIAKEAWERLGVKLTVVPKTSVQSGSQNDKFMGGLKVIEVRNNSPASREKIAKGDIIVGIMSWQTPNMEALNWILKNDDFVTSPSAKFYVFRNNQFWTAAMKVGNQRTR